MRCSPQLVWLIYLTSMSGLTMNFETVLAITVGGEGTVLGGAPASRPHLPRNNLLVDLNGLVSKEGRVAGCHLIDENPQGPPVHSLVVALE